MLYLTRKLGQSIIINGDIEVKVVEIKGKTAKLGFEFPKTATILRKEVLEKVVEQNKQSASVSDEFFGSK
jgi:carbon storage regulator